MTCRFAKRENGHSQSLPTHVVQSHIAWELCTPGISNGEPPGGNPMIVGVITSHCGPIGAQNPLCIHGLVRYGFFVALDSSGDVFS